MAGDCSPPVTMAPQGYGTRRQAARCSPCADVSTSLPLHASPRMANRSLLPAWTARSASGLLLARPSGSAASPPFTDPLQKSLRPSRNRLRRFRDGSLIRLHQGSHAGDRIPIPCIYNKVNLPSAGSFDAILDQAIWQDLQQIQDIAVRGDRDNEV